MQKKWTKYPERCRCLADEITATRTASPLWTFPQNGILNQQGQRHCLPKRQTSPLHHLHDFIMKMQGYALISLVPGGILQPKLLRSNLLKSLHERSNRCLGFAHNKHFIFSEISHTSDLIAAWTSDLIAAWVQNQHMCQRSNRWNLSISAIQSLFFVMTGNYQQLSDPIAVCVMIGNY